MKFELEVKNRLTGCLIYYNGILTTLLSAVDSMKLFCFCSFSLNLLKSSIDYRSNPHELGIKSLTILAYRINASQFANFVNYICFQYHEVKTSVSDLRGLDFQSILVITLSQNDYKI